MSDVRAVVMALNASSAPGARFLSGCMAAARPRYLRRQAHELVGMRVDGGWAVGYNSSAAKNPLGDDVRCHGNVVQVCGCLESKGTRKETSLGDDVRSPSARVFREQGDDVRSPSARVFREQGNKKRDFTWR
jgi:hypothetical protein